MEESRKHQICLKNGRRKGEDGLLALVNYQVGSAVQNTFSPSALVYGLCSHLSPSPNGIFQVLGKK